MKAYIQRKGNDWLNLNAYSANKGLSILGYEIVHFQAVNAEAPDVEYEKEDIVFGGIPVVLDGMKKMGIKKPETINYPESLSEYLGRSIKIKTIHEIRQMANEEVEPFFIKPKNIEKDFTGFVFRSFVDLLNITHVDGDLEVWFVEMVDFVSEYRVYYLNNKIIGCKNYHGDSLTFPDSYIVREMFDKYTDRFIAGSFDVGVTSDGRTLLVEVNDAYSLGNYGIGDISYANMISARWNELRKNKGGIKRNYR